MTGDEGFLFGPGPEGRLYRSPDGGVTAQAVGTATLPSGDGLYRTVYARGGVVAAWHYTDATFLNGHAYFSRDNGETWVGGGIVPQTFVDDFAVMGDTLIFATLSEDLGTGFGPLRVVWSVDNGATWVSQPLDANPIGSEGAFSRSLFVDRGALHAVTTRGVYRAREGAQDWVLVTDGDLGLGDGRLNVYNSAVTEGAAYVSQGSGCGTFLPGVYRRLTGQTEWTRRYVEQLVGAPSEACYPENGLAASGDTLVQVLSLPVGVINPGVPTSFDRGETWTFVSAGLPSTADQGVRASEAFAANGNIYVYATGCETPSCFSNLYRLVPSRTVALESEPVAAALRIWPNPAHDALTVTNSGSDGLVVRVLDMTGRVVQRASGSGGSVMLDTKAFSPGVYVVEVTTGEERVTSRFTVVR